MEVHASVLDSKQIYYKCPVCNGTHSHGSDGNFDNRIEHRLSHCNGEQVRIVINNATRRVQQHGKEQLYCQYNWNITAKHCHNITSLSLLSAAPPLLFKVFSINGHRHL